MNEIEFVKKQMLHVRSRTKSLLEPVDEALWYEIPEGINSSLAWQAGHIVLAQYFNCVYCAKGPDRSFYEVFPIKTYANAYGMNTTAQPRTDDSPSKEDFLTQMNGVLERCLVVVENLTEEDWLAPTAMEHPTYKTVGDVIHWQYHHEMWHLGQIAMIRRGLGDALKF